MGGVRTGPENAKRPEGARGRRATRPRSIPSRSHNCTRHYTTPPPFPKSEGDLHRGNYREGAGIRGALPLPPPHATAAAVRTPANGVPRRLGPPPPPRRRRRNALPSLFSLRCMYVCLRLAFVRPCLFRVASRFRVLEVVRRGGSARWV